MLKKRIIATLIIKDGIVVQSIGFKKYLPLGKPQIAIEFLNQWGIDEIVYLDISATKNNVGPDYKTIKESAKMCQVPLTVGGGITNVNQMKELMNCGADKISLNNTLLNDLNLVSRAAQVFGNQCIVASVDVEKIENSYKVYNYLKNEHENIDLEKYISNILISGAGEIFVNSVDRDGSYLGYDYELINNICKLTSVPVICSGGAKNGMDMKEVLKMTNVSGASASNFFHFTEHSVIVSKTIIKRSIDVRLDTQSKYTDFSFDKNMRIKKRSDKYLEDMLFVKIEKDII